MNDSFYWARYHAIKMVKAMDNVNQDPKLRSLVLNDICPTKSQKVMQLYLKDQTHHPK